MIDSEKQSGLRAVSRRTFRALSVRNFRLFFVGQSISQVGNWLASVAAILLVLHRTQSGFAVGLMTSCQVRSDGSTTQSRCTAP